MSAVLGPIAGAAQALTSGMQFDLARGGFYVPQSSRIGNVIIECSIEEAYSDKLEITEHPVEAGASITDHSYLRPSEVVFKCGWSNSSAAAVVGAVSALVNKVNSAAVDYVTGIYSQLLALQEAQQPITI